MQDWGWAVCAPESVGIISYVPCWVRVAWGGNVLHTHSWTFWCCFLFTPPSPCPEQTHSGINYHCLPFSFKLVTPRLWHEAENNLQGLHRSSGPLFWPPDVQGGAPAGKSKQTLLWSSPLFQKVGNSPRLAIRTRDSQFLSTQEHILFHCLRPVIGGAGSGVLLKICLFSVVLGGTVLKGQIGVRACTAPYGARGATLVPW